MKKDQIISKFLVIGFGTIISMLIGLVSFSIITRIIDPAEMGKMSIFDTYGGIAIMVICMGLDQAFVRFYYDSDENGYKHDLLIKCIVLPVGSAIVISLIMLLLVYNNVMNFELGKHGLVGLCFFVIIQIIYRFSELVVRLKYDSKFYSFLNILSKLLYFILVIILVYFSDLQGFSVLMVSTVIVGFIMTIISILHNNSIWFCKDISHRAERFSSLIKYGYPFILSMGITTVFQALDRLAINYYCSYTDVGVYSSALTLVNVFAVFQAAFTALWGPMMVEHNSNNPHDKEYYRNAYSIVTVIMFFIGICFIFAKDILVFLAGEKYRFASYIVPCLAFNPIMYTISETTCCGIVLEKKSKLNILVALGACVTNFIGNMIMVPLVGPKGAAFSTGIAYIVFFLLRTLFSNMVFDTCFKLEKIFILSFFVYLFALYCSFYSFGVFTFVGFLICMIILFILYKKWILLCVKYIKEYIANCFVKS